MRTTYAFLLAGLFLLALAFPAAAEEVPLLDGHSLHGAVTEVTADGLKLETSMKSGGSAVMKVGVTQIDPHWWYAKRDAALGDDAKQRLELAVWAVENGLFRQGKAQFEKARKLDPKAAQNFQDHIIPTMREGIAGGLVNSAHRAMDAGKLDDANKMLQAVITRFGDTHAAKDARDLQPTLEHRRNAKLQQHAKWQKSQDDAKASEQAHKREQVTSPIVALIRQGNNIMGHMPPMAAQSAGVAHTKQAAKEYDKALRKIDAALKAHADDPELVKSLQSLQAQAQNGLVQTHVTAGDIYTTTGNYTDALATANQLEVVDPGSSEAAAMRGRVDQAQSYDQGGIAYAGRWVGSRGGGRGRRR